MQKLFTLGKLFPADWIKPGEQPRCQPHELELVMEDSGAVRLANTVPPDQLFGKYFYRSGTNQTMKDALKDVVDSIGHVYPLKEGDIWTDIACFPKNSFVLTKKGYQDISKIQIGKEVLCHDGKYHKVVRTYKRDYDGDLIKLKLKTLNSNTCMTPNHPVMTANGWKEAGSLTMDDMISVKTGMFENNIQRIDLYEIIENKHKHKINVEGELIVSASNGNKSYLPRYVNIDENFIKIIGYYIGEGDACGGSGIRISMNKTKEMEKIKEIDDFFQKTFGLSSEIYDGNGDCVCIRINSRLLSVLFKNLCGDESFNKKIPIYLLRNDLIPVFLNALWFTDGHISFYKTRHNKQKTQYVYSSVSKRLMLDLYNILESIGIDPQLNSIRNDRGFSKKDGTIFRLSIVNDNSVSIFSDILEGKIVKTTVHEKFCLIRQIERIESINCEVFNLEVEDSHSYVCDAIVVHNCNDGSLLSNIPKEIIRIGIDPAGDDYLFESTKHSDLVIQDFFSAKAFKESPYGERRAKVVTCIAMLYDILDIDGFFRDLQEVLDDDGLFVAQLSYSPLMIRQNAFDNILAEHVYYYCLGSFKKIAERNGFKLMDVELNNVNGGSFRVYMMKSDGNESLFSTQTHRDVAQVRIESLLDFEDKNNYERPESWIAFFDSINNLRDEVVGFIKEETSKGKTFMGYGSSTKGSTLLEYFGLDSTLITAIAERNPRKWGLVTAGTNIPVISEEQMRQEHPDYLLVLPWHFVKEFTEREKEYLRKGGKMIVPCPRFEIIEWLG